MELVVVSVVVEGSVLVEVELCVDVVIVEVVLGVVALVEEEVVMVGGLIVMSAQP